MTARAERTEPAEPTQPAERIDADRIRRQRVGAYGIAHDAQGRVLLVRAATYLTVAGMWFLPGGGVEHGETPAEALRREVHEETGLLIGSVSLLGVLSDTWPIPDGTLLHTVRLVYQLDEWSGILRDEASGSSDRAAWFSHEELEAVPLVRYVREALERYAGHAGDSGVPRPLYPGAMTTTDVPGLLDTLAGSHDRLSQLVSELDEDALRSPSYCDEWNIAQVLSHIGSGAEILGRNVDSVVDGDPPPSRESFPAIWDRWNAMAPREVRDAALATDGELVERLEHLGDALYEMEFTLFGVMHTDAAGLISMRLSEHAVHTWDIAVALDASALVDPDAIALLLERLPRTAGWLGKAERADVERPFSVRVVTSSPERDFRLDVADDVTLAPAQGEARGEAQGEASAPRALHLPAEAFVRLLYGRLDDEHSPAVDAEERPALDALRSVFRGI